MKVIPETRVDRTKLDIYFFVFTDLYPRGNLKIALHEMNTLLQQKQTKIKGPKKKQSKKQKTKNKNKAKNKQPNKTEQSKAKQNKNKNKTKTKNKKQKTKNKTKTVKNKKSIHVLIEQVNYKLIESHLTEFLYLHLTSDYPCEVWLEEIG